MRVGLQCWLPATSRSSEPAGELRGDHEGAEQRSARAWRPAGAVRAGSPRRRRDRRLVPLRRGARQQGDRPARLQRGKCRDAAGRRRQLLSSPVHGARGDGGGRPGVLPGLQGRPRRASRWARGPRSARCWPALPLAGSRSSACCGGPSRTHSISPRSRTRRSYVTSTNTADRCCSMPERVVPVAITRSWSSSGTRDGRTRTSRSSEGSTWVAAGNDDHHHRGDPQVMDFPIVVRAPTALARHPGGGPRPGGHDLEHTFRERWYGSSVLDIPSPFRQLYDRAYHMGAMTGTPAPRPAPRRRHRHAVRTPSRCCAPTLRGAALPVRAARRAQHRARRTGRPSLAPGGSSTSRTSTCGHVGSPTPSLDAMTSEPRPARRGRGPPVPRPRQHRDAGTPHCWRDRRRSSVITAAVGSRFAV